MDLGNGALGQLLVIYIYSLPQPLLSLVNGYLQWLGGRADLESLIVPGPTLVPWFVRNCISPPKKKYKSKRLPQFSSLPWCFGTLSTLWWDTKNEDKGGLIGLKTHWIVFLQQYIFFGRTSSSPYKQVKQVNCHGGALASTRE